MKKKEINPNLDNGSLYRILNKQLYQIKNNLLKSDSNHQSLILALNQNLALINEKIKEMRADIEKNQEYINIFDKVKNHKIEGEFSFPAFLVPIVNAIIFVIFLFNFITSPNISESVQVVGGLFSILAFFGIGIPEYIILSDHKAVKVACQDLGISKKEYKLGREKVFEKDLLSKFERLQKKYEEAIGQYGSKELPEKQKLDIFFDQISQALHKAEKIKDAKKRVDYTAKLMALNEYYQQELLKIKDKKNKAAETELKNLLIEKVAVIEFAMKQDLKSEEETEKIKRDANIIREQGEALMTADGQQVQEPKGRGR